ncbi:alpha/beta fold hydrolase [Bacillus sp. JCM 19041]|uniref:alpha/beta hydrolase n=1 Tax=Bacillus sp. JCM 19041 TaxID=1460637 RepID=UPI0006D0946A
MKAILASIPLLLIVTTACSNEKPPINETKEELFVLLSNSEFETVHEEYFSDELKENLSISQLSDLWEELTLAHGTFDVAADYQESPGGSGNTVVETQLSFTDGYAESRMIFNEKTELIALSFEVGDLLPNSIVEEPIIIGEGGPFELEGMLTLPTKVDSPFPAIVIVHGSGPSDRDGTAYAYKPYKDLAWGLAEKGVAVLRYDKRSLIYPESFDASVTIHEETIEDAVAAGSLLVQDERISSVYIVGHSLGGMVAPRALAQSDIFTGMVSLAGSLRSLTDIIQDQNIYFHEIGHLTDEELNHATADFRKSENLDELEDSDILFGMPARYFKDLEAFDDHSFLENTHKPILIMQGEDDFQVTATKDFPSWKEALRHHPDAEMKLYPGLNHMFIHYDGPGQGTLDEYLIPGKVEKKVIQDLSEWLLSRERNEE